MNKSEQLKQQEETTAFDNIRITPVGCGIRVKKWVAQKWLLENRTIICNAYVHHLQIKNLGLGVCEVSRAPLQVKETKMVKEFLT